MSVWIGKKQVLKQLNFAITLCITIYGYDLRANDGGLDVLLANSKIWRGAKQVFAIIITP